MLVAVKKNKTPPSIELFQSGNLLPLKDMFLTEDVEILTGYLSDMEKGKFVSQMKKHYVNVFKFIKDKYTKNTLLKYLKDLKKKVSESRT